MNQKVKTVLMILAALYVISPIDVMPGAFDDLIMVLLSMAAQKKSWLPGVIRKVI